MSGRRFSAMRVAGTDRYYQTACAARRTTTTPNMQVGEASNRGQVAKLPEPWRSTYRTCGYFQRANLTRYNALS